MNPEFDHVAIVVGSLTDFVPVLERLTGAEGSPPETVEAQGVEVSFVGAVEVIQPTSPDSGVGRFLAKRGPGLHHIAYRVPDVDDVMARLSRAGMRFTSDKPMTGRAGHRVAFLHPSSAGGVLIEFVEKGRGLSR